LGPEGLVSQTISKIVGKSKKKYNVLNLFPWQMPEGYMSETTDSEEDTLTKE